MDDEELGAVALMLFDSSSRRRVGGLLTSAMGSILINGILRQLRETNL